MWTLLAGLLMLQAAGGPPAAASVVLSGPLLPEASPANAPGALLLDGFGDSVTLDLGRLATVAALVLQADGDDVYFVEGSADGIDWSILWRVGPVAGPPGLRTRWTALDAPRLVRHIRVRAATGTGLLSVSRLRVHEALPRAWPPTLDHSRPGSARPWVPWIERTAVGPLRELVAVFALFAVAWSAAARWRPDLGHRRARRVCLGAAAVLALVGWTNFLNFRFPGFTHHWEVFHYYVGSKYFPELRYTELYACAAVAEAEEGKTEELAGRRIRDLHTNGIVFASSVLAVPSQCTGRFTAERWAAFRRDVGVFRSAMGPGAWAAAQLDHGFNATPVWTLTGRAIASLVPATPGTIPALAALDLLLILAMLAVLLRTFGFESACVAAIFFGLNSLSRFAWTGGAFLRYDWLLAATAGVCALRARRDVLAGAALAGAALLRIFPACLVAGVALKLLAEVVSARSLRPLAAYARFGAGLAVVVVLLVPAASLVHGPTVWYEFEANSRKYLGTEAQNFIGLRTVLAYRPSRTLELTTDPWRPDTSADWIAGQAAASRATRVPFALLVGGFVLLLAVAAHRHERWVAAVLGAGLLPMALKMANYYYGLMALYGALWCVSPLAGFVLVAVAWASNLVAEIWLAYDQRSVWVSVLVCAYAVWVTFHAWRAGAATDRPS